MKIIKEIPGAVYIDRGDNIVGNAYRCVVDSISDFMARFVPPHGLAETLERYNKKGGAGFLLEKFPTLRVITFFRDFYEEKTPQQVVMLYFVGEKNPLLFDEYLTNMKRLRIRLPQGQDNRILINTLEHQMSNYYKITHDAIKNFRPERLIQA